MKNSHRGPSSKLSKLTLVRTQRRVQLYKPSTVARIREVRFIMDRDLNNIRRCFQPRQWFNCEGELDTSVLQEEDTFMWVYRVVKTKDSDDNEVINYHTGYFMPDGTWQDDAVYPDKAAATSRVNYLNGGKGRI